MASDVELRALAREIKETNRALKEISKALNQLVYMFKEDRRDEGEDKDAS